MTALACLRVEITAAAERVANVGPLVRKFAMAYLESRWSWPRKFAPLTDTSFLISDPQADALDPEELRQLSHDLQAHLFGVGDEGEVSLLLFEGSHDSIMAFAAMDLAKAAAAVDDAGLLPPGGRLTRLRPHRAPLAAADDLAWEEPASAEAPEPPPRPNPHWAFETPAPRPPIWEGVQGVYFTLREVFYGDVVTYRPHGERTHLSLLDGPEHLPRDHTSFDAECVGIAARLLGQRRKGAPIYLPISFSRLVRPNLREAYRTLLDDLPVGRRQELAAAIYDVPRDPLYGGLSQALRMLAPFFSAIDLRCTDPAFEVEKLQAGTVNSVTLILPDGDPLVRLSTMRRFAERLDRYKQRRIWPAVSNVRRRAEVDAAARLHIPFLTGPAVCPPVSRPVGGMPLALDQLPVSEATFALRRAG
ncbi:MAG: hypothetical protein JSR98_08140 [Proteobacteria bacterium]|nr:hypothetical protein [Pseudomonadota bacterium]